MNDLVAWAFFFYILDAFSSPSEVRLPQRSTAFSEESDCHTAARLYSRTRGVIVVSMDDAQVRACFRVPAAR